MSNFAWKIDIEESAKGVVLIGSIMFGLVQIGNRFGITKLTFNLTAINAVKLAGYGLAPKVGYDAAKAYFPPK